MASKGTDANENPIEDPKTTAPLVDQRSEVRGQKSEEPTKVGTLNSTLNPNPEPGTLNPEPSAVLVKIERVEREDGPLIRMPYESGSPTTEHWDFDPIKNVFEVTAIVAATAIETGFFRAVK
ncbi:MAG: hypothetical protein AABN33_18445 [Acidobacteriota bacterium]